MNNNFQKFFGGCLIASTITLCNTSQEQEPTYKADMQWAVVGAGPAGIMSVGLLMDLGINAQDIVWIDPEFNVGRIGKYYQHVPANASTRIFFDFLNACKTFRMCASEAIDTLLFSDLESFQPLEIVVKPLQVITDHLCGRVLKKQKHLTSLSFKNDVWEIGTDGENITSAHVILAIGSRPKSLHYEECLQELPLDLAIDRSTLATLVTPTDTVAVIGSAHSAILILKFLSELSVARILNFYIHQPEFHHPEYSLGGLTATWAKEVLLAAPPGNLLRVFNTKEARKAWLPLCTKIIYAAGYERNDIPPINGTTQIIYDDSSGVIAPRLFGIGIAFPEKYIDDSGMSVAKIGLSNFMEYALRVMPQWINTKEPLSRFASFEELFYIIPL